MIWRQFYYLAFMLFMIFLVLTFIAAKISGVYDRIRTLIEDEVQRRNLDERGPKVRAIAIGGAVVSGVMSGTVVHFLSRAFGLETTLPGSLWASAFTSAMLLKTMPVSQKDRKS